MDDFLRFGYCLLCPFRTPALAEVTAAERLRAHLLSVHRPAMLSAAGIIVAPGETRGLERPVAGFTPGSRVREVNGGPAAAIAGFVVIGGQGVSARLEDGRNLAVERLAPADRLIA
jgi:hypothetical protein